MAPLNLNETARTTVVLVNPEDITSTTVGEELNAMDFITMLGERTYGLNKDISREDSLTRGYLYCLKARNGQTAYEVKREIEQASAGEKDPLLHMAVETEIYWAALTHLCPDQTYRINP